MDADQSCINEQSSAEREVLSLSGESEDVAATEKWSWRFENWDGNRWRDYLSSMHTRYGTQPLFGLKIPIGLIKRVGSNESLEIIGRRITEHGPAFIEFLQRYIEPASKIARIQAVQDRNRVSQDDMYGLSRAQDENDRLTRRAKRDLKELKNAVLFFESRKVNATTSLISGDLAFSQDEPRTATEAVFSQ